MDQHYTAELTDAEALALAQAATMETEREPSADERAGMDWSSLPESERAAWVGRRKAPSLPQAIPGRFDDRGRDQVRVVDIENPLDLSEKSSPEPAVFARHSY